MKNYKLSLALAGALALTGTLAHAQIVTWASTTTGDDGDWAVGANWTGGNVPGSGDRADWNTGITITSSANVTVNGIRHGSSGTAADRGGLIIDGGTFTSTGEMGLGWNNAGDYTVTGSNTVLTTSGDILIRGNDNATGWTTVFNVEDGATVNVGNRLRVRDDVNSIRAYAHTLNISGGSSFSIAGDFVSAGGRGWGYAYNIEGNDLTINLSGIGSTFAVAGDHASLLTSMINSDHLVVSGQYSLDYDTTTAGWTTLTVSRSLPLTPSSVVCLRWVS